MAHTWIELDLALLAANVRALRAALGPGVDALFVVKSNAYGHGLVPVARAAWQAGVTRFVVVHMDEVAALRAALPEARILLVGVAGADAVPELLAWRAEPVVVGVEQAEVLGRAAAAAGGVLAVHAKVDTGMGRIGLPWEQAGESVPRLARQPGLRVVGLCTHLAAAGDAGEVFTREQLRRYQAVEAACRAAGLTGLWRHVSNSSAVLRSAAWDFDAVRAGLLLYGYAPAAGARAVLTQPILQWKTRVVQVKRVPAGFPVSYDCTWTTPQATTLATLDVGYADGYSRRIGNRGWVLIRGRRCPVVGRVTMNMIVADAGSDAAVAEGDEVVLLGSQGTESITATHLAEWCGSLSTR